MILETENGKHFNDFPPGEISSPNDIFLARMDSGAGIKAIKAEDIREYATEEVAEDIAEINEHLGEVDASITTLGSEIGVANAAAEKERAKGYLSNNLHEQRYGYYVTNATLSLSQNGEFTLTANSASGNYRMGGSFESSSPVGVLRIEKNNLCSMPGGIQNFYWNIIGELQPTYKFLAFADENEKLLRVVVSTGVIPVPTGAKYFAIRVDFSAVVTPVARFKILACDADSNLDRIFTRYSKSNIQLTQAETNIFGINDAWSPLDSYTAGIMRIHNEGLWECLIANSGQEPVDGSIYWRKVNLSTIRTQLNELVRVDVLWSGSQLETPTTLAPGEILNVGVSAPEGRIIIGLAHFYSGGSDGRQIGWLSSQVGTRTARVTIKNLSDVVAGVAQTAEIACITMKA